MNTTRTLSIAACIAGIATLVPAAADAAVTPGARYDGSGGKPTTRQFLTVSKDAKKLSGYLFAASGRCSDGGSFAANSELGKPRTIALDATGAFSVTQTERNADTQLRGKSYSGTLRNTLTGQSTPDGTAITVTIAGTYVARGIRCTTSATVTLYRDGTPQAPFSNESMTTGTYPGISGKGFSIRRFRALAPAGELRNIEVRGVARCSDGRRFPVRASYAAVILSPRYTFAAATGISSTNTDGPATEAAVEDRLTLRLFKRGASYGYRGTYSARVTVTRGTRTIKRCRLPFTRFQQGIRRAG